MARRLGHANGKKLHFHFPELCQQIRQQRQAYLTDSYQKLQTQFEAILAENPARPPPALTEVARRLECDPSTLKRLCPVQAQALRARCQGDKEAKKLAAEQALQTILANEEEGPPAMKVLAKELGYTYDTLRRYFPELMAEVLAKRQAFVRGQAHPAPAAA